MDLPPSVFADRAVSAYEAMQRWFYIGGRRSLYRETSAKSSPDAYLWPFSRALQGTLSLAGMSPELSDGAYDAAVKDRLSGLKHYWDRRARVPALDSSVRLWFGRGGDKYHDDNVWVALALVQCYRAGLLDSLADAALLFAFSESGWDSRSDNPTHGGVFWVEQGLGVGLTNHDRGTGTSAGSAMLGFHLARLEYPSPEEARATERFRTAQRMLGWVERHLSSSSFVNAEGPFWNAVDGDGNVDPAVWSYNQGVVIGARIAEYRITREPGPLQQAEAIARQTLAWFRDFRNHPPSFNAMCFQNLLMLYGETEDRDLQADILHTLRDFAEWTWDADTGARDPTTNLFSFDDAGCPSGADEPAKLQDQGAMVHLNALLAWDPEDYPKLC